MTRNTIANKSQQNNNRTVSSHDALCSVSVRWAVNHDNHKEGCALFRNRRWDRCYRTCCFREVTCTLTVPTCPAQAQRLNLTPVPVQVRDPACTGTSLAPAPGWTRLSSCRVHLRVQQRNKKHGQRYGVAQAVDSCVSQCPRWDARWIVQSRRKKKRSSSLEFGACCHHLQNTVRADINYGV